MRFAVLALVFLAGCGPNVVTTSASKRIALTPSPRASAPVRGSPGVGLAGRMVLMDPRDGSQGNGIGVPSLQPEVGAVFKFAERAYGSYALTFSPGADARRGRTDLPKVRATLAQSTELGLGYDFQLTKRAGIHASTEVGITWVPVTVEAAGSGPFERTFVLPSGRMTVAPYVELGDFRLFAGGVLGTDVWSEGDSTVSICTYCLGATDNGRTLVQPMGMVGAGTRFRPGTEWYAVSLELWVPVTTAGVRHPPQLLISVDLGDFDFSPSRRSGVGGSR